MNTQQQEAETFLCALWEGVPEPHKFLTWTLGRKYSLWWNDPEEAASAVAGKPDEYVGVGLADPTKTKLVMNERAKANEISGIAGFGLDIDYQDGAAHKGKALPPDEESAHKLLDAMPLRPTLVVHSGHGLQAWWLFKEHLIFSGDADRMRAAIAARDWNATLAAKAKDLGWEVDSVHDLARVLRIPGTINTKGGQSVVARLIKHDGPRYEDLDSFTAVCVQAPVEVAGRVGPKLYDAPRPHEFWDGILEGVDEGSRNNSLASIAGRIFGGMADINDEGMRRFNWKILELVNNQFQPPLEFPEFNKTVASILKKEVAKRAAEEALIELEQSEQFAEVAPSDERMRLIAAQLSAEKFPLVKIIKKGKEGSEYAFELENGERIVVGSVLNQDAVRKAVFDHTAGTKNPVVIRLFKKEGWLAVCRRISAAAEEVDFPEYNRATAAAIYLGSYLDTKQGSKGLPDLARMMPQNIQSGSPFIDDGYLHVTIPEITKTLRTAGNSWNDRDWANGLHDLGFDRHVVNKVFPGDRKTKKYWRCPVDSLAAKWQITCTVADINDSRSETAETA